MKKIFPIIINIVVSSLFAVLIVYAYSEPANPAPEAQGSNTDAPLNTGTNAQSKAGGLVLGTGLLSADHNALVSGRVVIENGIIKLGDVVIEHKSGTNPSCSDNTKYTPVFIKWKAKDCGFCATPEGWVLSGTPSCQSSSSGGGGMTIIPGGVFISYIIPPSPSTCIADTYTDIICMGN